MKTKITLIACLVAIGLVALFSKPKRMDPKVVDTIIESHVEKITPAIQQMINPDHILKSKEPNEYDYTASTAEERRLKTSRYLLAKALPSENEREYLKSLYADKVYIQWIVSLIQKPDPSLYTYSEEVKRMDAVAVIEAAASWKDNPERDAVIEVLTFYLRTYTLNNSLPENIKKSYSADYVEMYKILFENNQDLANEMEQKETNPQRKKWIRFARTFFELGENS
jgi:hypothetical protein